jgi:hypothetical protein
VFRLPVLAGAAGALGAQYCSPYLAVDGAYGRQPGQTSAIDSSRLVRFLWHNYMIYLRFIFNIAVAYC